MPADPIAPQADPDGLMAELYEAAQGFAVRHGFKGTFIEVVLELWDALREKAHRTGPIKGAESRRVIVVDRPANSGPAARAPVGGPGRGVAVVRARPNEADLAALDPRRPLTADSQSCTDPVLFEECSRWTYISSGSDNGTRRSSP